MPRQLDQLPPDATSLARRVQALEREVKELRAARRLTSATIGTMRTAPDGARVEISQNTQSLRVYAEDGETLLAELGPEDSGGGGGLWTRGLQNPNNMAAFLNSGMLQFGPVETSLAAVPASMYYDCDAFQYSDLTITSGAVGAGDHRALMILESLYDGQFPSVSIQGENSTRCDLYVQGAMTAANIAYGSVSITPSAANVPTSVTVNGLGLTGSSFYAQATASSVVPGTQITGVSTSSVSSNGLTVWVTRTNTTSTVINWMVVGLA